MAVLMGGGSCGKTGWMDEWMGGVEIKCSDGMFQNDLLIAGYIRVLKGRKVD